MIFQRKPQVHSDHFFKTDLWVLFGFRCHFFSVFVHFYSFSGICMVFLFLCYCKKNIFKTNPRMFHRLSHCNLFLANFWTICVLLQHWKPCKCYLKEFSIIFCIELYDQTWMVFFVIFSPFFCSCIITPFH